MTLLTKVRESKLFKAIADISVVHWVITVVPGLVSGIEAAMHGTPLETIILYFLAVSALMLVLLHFGGLAWAKYSPTVRELTAGQPRNLWRLIVPLGALFIVLGANWLIRRKVATAPTLANLTTSTTQPRQQVATTNNDSTAAVLVSTPQSQATVVPLVRKQTEKRTISPPRATPRVSSPVGKLGFSIGQDSTLILHDSQIGGYAKGVEGGDHSQIDLEHSQIQASGDALPPMPSPTPSTFIPRTHHILSGITIKMPKADLPLTPIPSGAFRAEIPIEQQRAIIAELANQWKKEDAPRSVGKQALRWINEQLIAQRRDFLVEIPTNCPQDTSGLVPFYVAPNMSTDLNGVTTDGFEIGIGAGAGSHINATNVRVVDNCD